jgi:hypothetical protein
LTVWALSIIGEVVTKSFDFFGMLGDETDEAGMHSRNIGKQSVDERVEVDTTRGIFYGLKGSGVDL